jgi:O-antigen ligase
MICQSGSVLARRAGVPSLRWIYIAVALFVCQPTTSFSLVDHLVYGVWVGKQGDKLTQSLNMMQIIIGIVLFCRGFSKSNGFVVGEKLALALVCFLTLTVLWSVDPDTTIRRGVLYLLFIVGMIGVANSVDGDEFMSVFRIIGFVTAAASIFLLVVAPEYVTTATGDFGGTPGHKNLLGPIMLAGTLATLHALRVNRRRRALYLLMLLLFTITTFIAKATTSLLGILVCSSISFLAVLFRRGGGARALALLFFAAMLSLPIMFGLYPDMFLDILGKDQSLSGRTDLWPLVMYCIAQRPMLGWGLMAFWSPTNPAAYQISWTLGWPVPEAHNGLLEMLLEVGLLGTIFFIFLFTRNIVLAVRCLRTPAREVALSSLLCSIGIIIEGVSEQVLVDPTFFLASIFFITGFMCDKMIRLEGRRRFPPHTSAPHLRSMHRPCVAR